MQCAQCIVWRLAPQYGSVSSMAFGSMALVGSMAFGSIALAGSMAFGSIALVGSMAIGSMEAGASVWPSAVWSLAS